MNDMDRFVRFRAEVPCAEVSPQAERRFQSALPSAERGRVSRIGTPLFRRARVALLASLALAVVAAIVLAVLPGRSGRLVPSLAVRLLADRAAAAAQSRTAVRPGQWVFREIKYQVAGYPDVLPNGTELTWTTAAGMPGYVNRGPAVLFVPGAIPYSKLGSLPSDPAALDRYLANQRLNSGLASPGQRPPYTPGRATPSEHAAMAFQQIEAILWDYVLPPKLAANLFRALAYIPGIKVRRGVTDIAGWEGIAFVMPQTELRGMSMELILNPADYRLVAIGSQVVPPSGNITPRSRSYPGIVAWEQSVQLAIIHEAYVLRPGLRA